MPTSPNAGGAGAAPLNVRVYWNFRSPYCYLASHRMWEVLDRRGARLDWRPLSGWDGRSPPERAKSRIPLVRQDVARWAERMNLPFSPPPATTDPSRAAAGSVIAEARGLLRNYVIAVMDAEWGHGRDIGDVDVLAAVADTVGIDRIALEAAHENPAIRARLDGHWRDAQSEGVFGVPTFGVGDQLFWGNDRLDFLDDHLRERGADGG